MLLLLLLRLQRHLRQHLLLLRHQVPRVELASLVRVDPVQLRVLRVLQLISLQRHAQRPPLDVPRYLQVCHQLERLLACHLVRVRLQADLPSRHLLAPFPQQVSAFRLHLVSAWLLVLHVQAQAVSAQVLAVVLVVPVFVLVLVAHAPVVLVDSVLVLVAHAPVLVDLVVLARVVPAVLVALVVVLVLVLVLADLVVLVAHAPAVPVVVLAQAVLVAVHVPAVVLAAPAVHATVNVVHLARSHVHVAGANSTNCSRSSRSTRTAMLRYPKARSSSSVAGQLRSSLRS